MCRLKVHLTGLKRFIEGMTSRFLIFKKAATCLFRWEIVYIHS